MEQLDKGLIDFGLVYGTVDRSKYESMEIPIKDIFGVLMRKDSPLAEKEWVAPEDLRDKAAHYIPSGGGQRMAGHVANPGGMFPG